ncbi:hypothetical protein CVIRNUC_004723 [Coccomyxa viridis]|uniref:Uncharacterized protein n=1 Tax=Coccomyxa viridis TaxID=1274662 RepID=A0AAV1I2J8_9CHLO|nr:hypothetical protein CVIRNUC_004723 [Coccomyxa viridis]
MGGSAARPLESVHFPIASCTDIAFLKRQLHGLAAEVLARLCVCHWHSIGMCGAACKSGHIDLYVRVSMSINASLDGCRLAETYVSLRKQLRIDLSDCTGPFAGIPLP